MSLRRRSLLALVVVALLVLTGCQADVTVGVDVEEDGSGVVEVSVALDADAVARVEGLDDLRTDDLEDAGWTVAAPQESDGGGRVLLASKPFVDPDDLSAVLQEVSGPAGPYAQLGLAVDRPFGRTDMRFEGVLDGSVGVDAFADPGVAAALDGLPFGQDLAALEAELGAPPGSFVGLALEVELPGSDAAAERWETTLDAELATPVLATAEVTRTQPLLLAGAAALLAVLLVLLVLIRLFLALRRRRRRRRAPRRARRDGLAAPHQDEPSDADELDDGRAADDLDGDAVRVVPVGAGSGSEDRDADEAAADGPVGLEMVVLGGPGATFGVRDQVDELVAFARANGSTLEYPRIAERYTEASRGGLSTAELWEALGVAGDPAALDAEMLGRYALTPGLREFVVRARDRGYRVAYLGDGPSAWAAQLRRTFLLDDLVEPWVVSAEIGAVLPSIAMFEGLRRISSVDPPSCLLIDDRLRVLEAARELGFGTAWFTPSGRSNEAPGHSIIRSFSDLLSA